MKVYIVMEYESIIGVFDAKVKAEECVWWMNRLSSSTATIDEREVE